jgi:hypothetical protein
MPLANRLFGYSAALLAALALGALWALLSLMSGTEGAWLAPLVALVLAGLLRFNQHPPGAGRALGCALAYLVAHLHAHYLIAAGFIAAQMGLELVDALKAVGAEMAFAVTRARITWADGFAWLVALLLAIALGWRQPGEAVARPKRR